MAITGRKPGGNQLVEAIIWVAEHLDDPGVTSLDAPSGVASSILRWAAEKPDEFFRRLLPRALIVQEQERKAYGAVDEAIRRDKEEIERLERRLRPFMMGQQRDFCENCWELLKDDAGRVQVKHMLPLGKQFRGRDDVLPAKAES